MNYSGLSMIYNKEDGKINNAEGGVIENTSYAVIVNEWGGVIENRKGGDINNKKNGFIKNECGAEIVNGGNIRNFDGEIINEKNPWYFLKLFGGGKINNDGYICGKIDGKVKRATLYNKCTEKRRNY